MSVIDLNLIYMADNPFAQKIYMRKDLTHESRQNDFLSNYGLSVQTQIPYPIEFI